MTTAITGTAAVKVDATTGTDRTFHVFPYDDVICGRCNELIGAFVGKARCWKCGTTAIVLKSC